MKCLYFLLFVAVAQAFVTREAHNTQIAQSYIPRPWITKTNIRVKDTISYFKVEWETKTNSDKPILGYRAPEGTVWFLQFANFQDVIVYGDQHLAAVAEIKQGLWYQIRVQAFTQDGYGPMSLMHGFRINPEVYGQRMADQIEKEEETEE
ncbi:hypothetical protein ABMA27_000634 [Loxostege sticticalis]|uniref:Fibronectin type-III domain-containing protein n=1 Tax=Loxostege sticticalis TaxID=481309 RepID=A0ABR3HZS3_LOXSC